jgi:hypothetical protein
MDVGRTGRGPARRILGFVLLAGAVALTLAACASTTADPRPTAGATAPGTATVAVRVYTASGKPAVPVGASVRGQCWTTSVAAPVPDAYRCFQGDKILDPCFAPARPATPLQVVCLAAPWSRGVLLRVSGSLPEPADGPAARPWAIQLDNGVRCVASTGMVPAVAGVNLAYHCADGGDAALRPSSTATPGTVTADYAAAGARTLHTMTVTTMWRA